MLKRSLSIGILWFVQAVPLPAFAQSPLAPSIDRKAAEIESKVVSWRRDFHQNPELGNRELRTSKIVAEHLGRLGLEVRTGVGKTGVVALLRGGRPGKVVALRADMDGLPVKEMVDLPFASKAKGTYNGQEVDVMHACGHDNHIAIMMGVAEVLTSLKDQIPGTIKFIFQPAEEGPPAGEEGGAALMIKEGVLENPRPDAIFGLHVFPGEVGKLFYRPGGFMAAADVLTIKIRGRQTHGALPWGGVDPIVVASQVVLGLQTITSRQVNLTKAPAIVTIGSIRGGIRNNIIPDEVELIGTVRTFDPEMQDSIHQRIALTAEKIAEASGATATTKIDRLVPVTFNQPALTEKMLATMKRVAGDDNVRLREVTTGAEDFSYFQQRIPGMFYFLGITPKGVDPDTAPVNHSPLFFADEGALPLGVRSMAHLAIDFLTSK